MSKGNKLIIVIIFILLLFTIIYLVVRSNIQEQPVNRMEAVGYQIGHSEEVTTIVTTTEQITTTTTTTTAITTTEPLITETQKVIETTEPLNETIIDYSNISRANLPNAYCNEVIDLKSYNPDTRGWISLSNSNISYAFTQTEDNAFYLDHDFDGNEDHAGWVFMDFRGIFDDNGQQTDVITLYGHNMANGSMFSNLKKYRDNPNFYQSNPIITLSSSNNYKYYKIFAYMICYGKEGSDFEYWKFSDLSDYDTFYYYVTSAFNKSLIITGVDVQYGDKILALSTCNSGSTSNNDRFVVLARMLRDGEDLYEGCYRIR